MALTIKKIKMLLTYRSMRLGREWYFLMDPQDLGGNGTFLLTDPRDLGGSGTFLLTDP